MTLIDCMEELFAVQNGPPLFAWTDRWNAAMKAGHAAVNQDHPGSALLAELDKLRMENESYRQQLNLVTDNNWT